MQEYLEELLEKTYANTDEGDEDEPECYFDV